VGNLPRVLPADLGARLDRSAWEEPRVFTEIQRLGAVEPDEMDRVFNRGVGMALVLGAEGVDEALAVLAGAGQAASVIGTIVEGGAGVQIT
jgi:phosphoribosylformylglycinamidine cyclo-ligase